MSVKKTSVFMGLLLGLGFAQAYADTPNYYKCSGKNIALTFFYDHSGINNAASLNLDLGKAKYSVDDKNIETQATVMGDVKSFTIKFLPDLEIKKASFIIPMINLGTNLAGESINEAKFKSQLVVTTIATPFIGGAYIGIVNASKYYDINCKASLLAVPL